MSALAARLGDTLLARGWLDAADLATSLVEGVRLAHDALHTGLAREKMDELASFTAVFREENQA